VFTRHVAMELKPNAAIEFAKVIDGKVLPLRRAQKGFRDLISFSPAIVSEAIAISFWDTRKDAEACNVTGFPEVLRTLTGITEGTPKVGAAEFVTSTFRELAAAKTA